MNIVQFRRQFKILKSKIECVGANPDFFRIPGIPSLFEFKKMIAKMKNRYN